MVVRRGFRGVRPGSAGGLLLAVVFALAKTGDAQVPGPKPPSPLTGSSPAAGPKLPPPVPVPGVKTGPLPPRIDYFRSGKLNCVAPNSARGFLEYGVSGSPGTIIIKQEGGSAIDTYLWVAPAGAVPPTAAAHDIRDAYANARVTGYLLQAFNANRSAFAQLRIPFDYLEPSPVLRLLEPAVRKTDLGGSAAGRRMRYSIAAQYSRLDSISVVYRFTPEIAPSVPRVTVRSDPPAAGVPADGTVRGTLTFELSWGGQGGWERLMAARGHADFTAERLHCGSHRVSADATVP